MTDDKNLLLKMHPCSHGLTDDAVNEIANAAELIRCEPDEFIHRADQPVTSVYLIIHGRLKFTAYDDQGEAVLQRCHTSGGQFGGIAAALSEPAQVDCIAQDPTTLLRFDYQAGLELTKRYPVFRSNMAQLIAGSLKQTLFVTKRPKLPKLVAIFHQTGTTRQVSHDLIHRLINLGESICALSDLPKWKPIKGVLHRCAYQPDSTLSEQEVRTQINEWLNTSRVIIDVASSFDFSRESNLLEVCEQILWCVTPENWKASVARLKALESKAASYRDKITVVWLLEDQDCAPLAPELRKLVSGDIKLSFKEPAENQDLTLRNGIERLVHLLRGVKIGVALSGGAARGMAHLGVLKVLEQNGIFPDMIAGTSAGAMNGTLCASGLNADYLVGRFINDLRPNWWFRVLPRGDQWYLLYKYRRRKFDPMLRKYLGEKQLEQLPLQMNTITVDLISGKAIVRKTGDSVHAIVESINLPVLATPINREGKALVDGGLIKNIPVDVLVENGCNFVIAVSVTAKIEQQFANNTPDTPTSDMKSASMIQTLMRGYLVQGANRHEIGVQQADVVIEPDATRFDLTAFTKTDQLAKVGEEATLKELQGIKQLLSRLDGKLFKSPA